MNASKWPQRPLLLVVVLLIAASVTAFFARQPSTISSTSKRYSVGDVAAEDIVSPRRLLLPDPLETSLRRQRELLKGPVLFRFDKSVSTQVVARFKKDVSATRESLLDSVQQTFGSRILDTNQVDGTVFRQLVIDFRRERSHFPITVVKAARWAQGDTEEKLQKQLSDKLRAASRKLTIADGWPAAAHGDHLRLIASEDLSRTNVDLIGQSQLVRRTNIVAISKVRESLEAQLPREQYATARYLAGFVEVNCFFDEELTRRLRAQRAEKIEVVNAYDAGQMIVARGGKVDGKIEAALDALNVRQPLVGSNAMGPRQIGLWCATAFFGGLALFVLARGVRRPGNKLVSAQNVVVLPRTDLDGRALESKLMPHLARALMNKLVRGLISQRSELITTQTAGTEQLNHLEQQLEQISTRLQARQAGYEKRIAELEKELAAAEEENRELIRAKIREARENLEWAKAQAAKQ